MKRAVAGLAAELRRRKVWRVAGAYVVAAAGVIALVSDVAPAVALPPMALSWVVILALAGLPVVLVLAWRFDLTWTGIERTEAASTPSGTATPDPVAELSDRSIVVLPFENLTPEANNEYFSDGLTEEIITDLSQLRSLRVISRTSAMLLKGSGKDLRTIGRELGVRYVLEGSVRKAGDRLRVTAQLIDAATDGHLWAERYDGDLGDIFSIQESVARAIADALRIEISPEEERALQTVAVPNIRAYDCYLRARHEVWVATAEALERAERYLQHARDIAGESAVIDAAAAYVQFQKANFGYAQDEAVEAAERYARHALKLDPDCAEAHMVLGAAAQAFRADLPTSIGFLERAQSLAPNAMDSIAWLLNARLLSGRHEDAVALATRLVRADPLDPLHPLLLGFALARAGRPAEGVEPTRNAYQMEPNSPHVLMLHAFVLASVGDKDELGGLQFPPEHTYLTRVAWLYRAAALGDVGAVDGLVDEDVERTARRDPDGALWLAEVYGGTGRTDEALGWLEQAVERGHLDYPYIAEYSPFLAPLRETDRFQRLSQRLRQAWEDFDA